MRFKFAIKIFWILFHVGQSSTGCLAKDGTKFRVGEVKISHGKI